MPKMGGRSVANVPRPRKPLSFRHRDLRCAATTLEGCPLCPAVI